MLVEQHSPNIHQVVHSQQTQSQTLEVFDYYIT